jgi:hypothetical protein
MMRYLLNRVALRPQLPYRLKILGGEIPYMGIPSEPKLAVRNDLVFGQVMAQAPNSNAQIFSAGVK